MPKGVDEPPITLHGPAKTFIPHLQLYNCNCCIHLFQYSPDQEAARNLLQFFRRFEPVTCDTVLLMAQASPHACIGLDLHCSPGPITTCVVSPKEASQQSLQLHSCCFSVSQSPLNQNPSRKTLQSEHMPPSFCRPLLAEENSGDGGLNLDGSY